MIGGKTQISRVKIPNGSVQIRGCEFRIPNSGCCMPDAAFQVPNHTFQIQDAGTLIGGRSYQTVKSSVNSRVSHPSWGRS